MNFDHYVSLIICSRLHALSSFIYTPLIKYITTLIGLLTPESVHREEGVVGWRGRIGQWKTSIVPYWELIGYFSFSIAFRELNES